MRHGIAILSLLLAGASDRRLLYDHTYHAGNYADVVKHSVLIQLLHYMQRKKSPMVYAETHSGAGAYPLQSKESQTLAEHEQGINRIYSGALSSEGPNSINQPTEKLLELMNTFSKENDGEFVYPGSPLVASSLCRDHDSLLLCEKEKEPFERLTNVLGGDKRVVMLRDNGYKALKRFENIRSQQRALVFVDPPYQMGSDTEQIASLVGFLQTHWRSARVAIWHPVSRGNRERADRLYQQVAKAAGRDSDCLATELYDESLPDVGTGMLLVNPPYDIDEELETLLPSLGRALGNEGTMQIRVEKL